MGKSKVLNFVGTFEIEAKKRGYRCQACREVSASDMDKIVHYASMLKEEK